MQHQTRYQKKITKSVVLADEYLQESNQKFAYPFINKLKDNGIRYMKDFDKTLSKYGFTKKHKTDFLFFIDEKGSMFAPHLFTNKMSSNQKKKSNNMHRNIIYNALFDYPQIEDLYEEFIDKNCSFIKDKKGLIDAVKHKYDKIRKEAEENKIDFGQSFLNYEIISDLDTENNDCDDIFDLNSLNDCDNIFDLNSLNGFF